MGRGIRWRGNEIVNSGERGWVQLVPTGEGDKDREIPTGPKFKLAPLSTFLTSTTASLWVHFLTFARAVAILGLSQYGVLLRIGTGKRPPRDSPSGSFLLDQLREKGWPVELKELGFDWGPGRHDPEQPKE